VAIDINVHVWMHTKGDTTRIIEGIQIIMADLSALKDAVARMETVEDSAIALLNGLKVKLDAAIASNDPAALSALSAQLGADADKLAAAVTTYTPAAP
jgi:hypothetical protein